MPQDPALPAGRAAGDLGGRRGSGEAHARTLGAGGARPPTPSTGGRRPVEGLGQAAPVLDDVGVEEAAGAEGVELEDEVDDEPESDDDEPEAGTLDVDPLRLSVR